MKTLINKHNPAIRITAPEITTAHPPVSNEGYVYWIPAINQMYNPIDWTLVEEEPVKEEICSKCVYHKKNDDCYYPYGGMRRRINDNGVCECNAFWEREQEEPKRKQSPALKKIVDNLIEEKLAKTRAEPEKIYYKMLDNKANCPFDKGNCNYCTVQFCGAREENHIETRSTAEPMDLAEDIKMEFSSFNKHVAKYGEESEDVVWLNWNSFVDIASHFYELGRQEEKAKAYDEALESARNVLETDLHESGVWAIKKIFPELSESEDERMIRVIRLALTDVPEERFTTEGTSLSEVYAWLEKQKEQKPRWKINNPYTTKWTKEMIDEKFEKLVEEFNPERSEEDEEKRDRIIQWLREYQKEFNPKYDSLSIESIESLVDWLKSLRPSWKPSEEQMKALSETIAFAPDTFKPKCTLMTLQNDLKKLMEE